MNYFSDIKLYKWLVIILIIINVLTLSFLWINDNADECVHPKARKEYSKKNAQERNERFLKKELNLTDDQLAQFNTLRSKHFNAVHTKKIEAHLIKEVLFEEVFKDSTNILLKDSLINAIAQKEAELELLNFKHFEALSSVCTPDQQDRLKHVILEVFLNIGDKNHRHGYKREKIKDKRKKNDKHD